MKKFLKIFGSMIIVIIFTLGVLYGLLYLAFQLGWTKEGGQIDSNSAAYETTQPAQLVEAVTKEKISENNAKLKDLCKLKIITSKYPQNGAPMQLAYNQTKSSSLLDKMIFVFNLKNNDQELQANLTNCGSTINQIGQIITTQSATTNDQNIYAWTQTEEWPIIVEAITKDKDAINKAASLAQIEPRLLIVPVIVEQLRLYFTEREYFKQFFKPLKILGVTNQMSMGVMSIKEKTAISVENNLKDKNSPFYPGEEFESLLDFKTYNPVGERSSRLTDQHDQFYAYLYGALYIKEIEAQWQKAGFPINDRPEIIATLYNLGFEHSKPNAQPQIGGSTLKIDNTEYTFGGLGSEFYYSGQMQDIFPFKIPAK